jgi:hypothetical protein
MPDAAGADIKYFNRRIKKFCFIGAKITAMPRRTDFEKAKIKSPNRNRGL